MLTGRRKILINLFKLSDIFILGWALFAAWLTQSQVEISMHIVDILAIKVTVLNLICLGAFIGIWHYLLKHFRLYEGRRLGVLLDEWKDILKATTLGSAIFYSTGKTFHIHEIDLVFILTFFAASSGSTLLFRTFLRLFLRKLRLHGRNLRNAIIVGTNDRAYEFAKRLEDDKELGFRVLGYVDSTIHVPHSGRKLLGKPADFSSILKDRVVDEVIITLPIKSSYEVIQQIISICEEQGVIVRHLNDLFRTGKAHSRLEEFEEGPFLTISSWPFDDWRQLAKRAFDIALSALVMVLTSPLMLFAALAIKLTSSGPFLFKQTRVGLNKRHFRLYKFRTMIADAETVQASFEHLNEMDGPVFKISGDPRITPIGKWLRKTSIDELPQLFNVLMGDMSLVGPRPLPIRDYNGFDEDWQRKRFSVLPGITCIWQISGRNEITFEEWMKMDTEYIEKWSLANDFKILLKTIPAVLRRNGAV